VLLRQVLS